MMKGSRFFRVILPFLIIILGIGVMAALVKSRSAPKKEAKTELGVLVRVFNAEKTSRRVVVTGTGTVKAARELTVIPQVSGRVTSIAPGLVSGGFFKKGEVLFEIEKTDYELALERARAAKARAEYDLAMIESKARVARAEWERLNRGSDKEPNPLVVYEPQMKDAKAALRSAEAAMEQAKVDLERTRITAPFNCRVRSEEVELGQYVRSGTGVAVLAGTDKAEITVPLPLDELHWLHIPRDGAGKASTATVRMKVNGSKYGWKGRVVRSVGEVDQTDRMMHVVASVSDPYGLSGAESGRPALPLGTFVEVEFLGKKLDGVFIIPRTALRDGSTVWTVGTEGKLRIKEVRPVRIEREDVIVGEGLTEGDRIILTNLTGAAEGLKLRVVGDETGKGTGKVEKVASVEKGS